jgi:hypothetical protein
VRSPRARLLIALLLLFGCDASPTPPRESAPATRERERAEEEDTPFTPDVLFPLSIGDRWRERVSEHGPRTRGVTAHTLEGHAVVFGQGETRPAFYRADAQEAALVDPQGRVLEPLLRAPVRVGSSFRYTLGEGPIAAPCEAEVVATRVRAEVGGASVEGCVRVLRQCVHPAGLVFESQTTRRAEELYCPRIGRVRSQQTLDPPLPTNDETAVVELLAYRVAGAPALAPPERFGCDGLLLLPSDAAAACGPEWRFVAEESVSSGCVHRFTSGEGTLAVRVTRRADAAAAATALDALAPSDAPRLGEARHVEREGLHVLAGTAGPHVVEVETRGCEPERAARLVPFVGTLVADETAARVE